ncbi:MULTISPECIES: metal ABC transporter ATP-binding protein [Snodgrassella]|uniref:metal ABC transporter ATP-binding protein n=1 Tax=Snodgrassella TaxID=1193515 RepID=UPI00226A34E9|nr:MULTISPECIES: metal ABC transporter ATP-binding protein [unclassified Snodgrassella]MCX8748280.1 metal ABC transporter ATP-binding protein [Snodgrassella sp. B3088]MCX8752734.1 metal ABC transporter ATP-binding protein [Snodgrassella sp. B3837]
MSIQVDNVTVSYRQRPAIHHLSIDFKPNEMWAIFGPNGAGKSTLLKAIMGLVRPDSGEIYWQHLQRSDIAYLPQQSDIDRSQPMSVFELVAMGLWYETGFFAGISKSMHQRIIAVLTQVGMLQYQARSIAQLSNGQFQRVLLARMLIQNARVLLLDEPFNAVDAATTFALLDILKAYQQQKQCTVITVLHDYEQVQAYFPYTLLIAREKIAAGKTDHVLTEQYLQQAAAAMQQYEQDQWCNR